MHFYFSIAGFWVHKAVVISFFLKARVGLPFKCVIVSLHRRYVRTLDPSEEEEDEEELYKAQTNGVSDGMTLFLFERKCILLFCKDALN